MWPAAQPLLNVSDQRIFGTVFQDTDLCHPEMIQQASLKAEQMGPNKRALGGKKVRDLETWGSAGFALLMQRALLMFCKAHNVAEAHVLDRWVNVMNAGDYSAPHCHYDAQSAILYVLDQGEEIPGEVTDGNFELIDARIPACCPYQPERPIRGLSPRLRPGMMLLFPAEFIHFVHLYTGNRPRITAALNISAGPPPTDRVIDPTKPVPMKVTNSLFK